MESVQDRVAWRAIPIAGLVAGTVFLLIFVFVNMLVAQVEASVPMRYFAALGMGTGVLSVDEVGIAVWIVGILIHYLLSILFTLFIVFVVHRWGMGVGIIGGGLMGFVLYMINIWGVTFLVDQVEWWSAMDNWVLLVAHILFGAVAGAVYEYYDTYDRPFMAEATTS